MKAPVMTFAVCGLVVGFYLGAGLGVLVSNAPLHTRDTMANDLHRAAAWVADDPTRFEGASPEFRRETVDALEVVYSNLSALYVEGR